MSFLIASPDLTVVTDWGCKVSCDNHSFSACSTAGCVSVSHKVREG